MATAQEPSSATVTKLLSDFGGGDPNTAATLLPLVYHELRRMARKQMRRERPGQTLQATALVHEAYLRLVEQIHVLQWKGRWHFFGAAAEAMHHILVEKARRRSCLKRGGGMQRSPLDNELLPAPPHSDDLLALDEALETLAHEHPQKAELVKLRYFAGLTIDEAAQAMGIATSTASRYWAYARAWLYQRIHAAEDDSQQGRNGN